MATRSLIAYDNGDVSIIYYENGVSKKADFFGVMLVKVIEK